MGTNVHAFKETDLRRAIRSARTAGLDVTSIDITKEGVTLRTAPKGKLELVVDNTAKNAADVVAARLG